MPKKPFMPTKHSDFADFLDNLVIKMPVHAVTLGITPAQITTVQDYAVMFNYLMDMQESYKTYKQEISAYKKLLRYGPGGGVMNPVPVTPTLPAAPAPVRIAIERYIRSLVAQLKAHPNYEEAIGEDLGIVGDEETINIHNMKPVLKTRLELGHPVILWTKGHADSLDIYVNRNDGAGEVYLANDTQPDYTDTTPLPTGGASASWDYRAAYKIGDDQVGHFSDVVKVAVRK